MTARTLAFVGTLTRPTPYCPGAHGAGLAVLEFDEATGALHPLHEVDGIDNPSYIAVDAAGRTLYAVSEVVGWHEGTATAYRIDRATGGLNYICKQPTRGSIAAYAGFDHTGRWLLVANYRMGPDGERPPQAVVVFPIESDGGLGPAASGAVHTGSGPNADRQEGPHPHCALASPDNRFVLVADLGIDRIVVYAFDAATGALRPGPAPFVPTAPGDGPRHLVFAPSGRFVYVTNELASSVGVYAWDATTGALSHVQTASTVPGGSHPDNTCSDIAISSDGRFVYAANRGDDSIAAFAVDSASGRLSAIGHASVQGRTPRQFTLDFTGRFLLVANQNSDELVVLARDPATGLLHDSGQRGAVATPMCVKLLRVPAR